MGAVGVRMCWGGSWPVRCKWERLWEVGAVRGMPVGGGEDSSSLPAVAFLRMTKCVAVSGMMGNVGFWGFWMKGFGFVRCGEPWIMGFL